MHDIINLNYNWTYLQDFKEEYLEDINIDGNMVNLPHTNIELPFNYFDEKDFCFISTYIKKLFIKNELQNKHLMLTFDGVMAYAEVYINGRFATSHSGGYLPFSVDIAPFVKYNEQNTILVIVNSKELADIPPFGNVIDYLTYGGIYREVYIEVLDKEYLGSVKITTYDTTKITFDVNAKLDATKNYTIVASILDSEEQILKKETYKNIDKDSLKFTMNNIVASYWDLDDPTLYVLSLDLYDQDKLLDNLKQTFGFRTVAFKKDGFYLNNKKIKLIGLNHHQSYPYVGYAMPRRVQQQDVKILKNELGVNITRMSHYSHSKHFLDECDRLGLLVFSEIPGWQHVSNKPAWREIVKQNVKEMINRDYNHPSIIIWGVRINESKDDDELYLETNKIAHELDNTRPTGGVRNFAHSSFNEDVYTYNDFVHNGGEVALQDPKNIAPKNVPYLVTEHNGHMFPTKKYDNEKRRAEQALRHLRVINAMMGNERIAGSIGWCMNDYNTHQQFGSGDKICYHGVLDMFRLPKYAAYTYASQSDIKPVLQPLTTLNSGDYDASFINEVYILTNCDYVEFYKNDTFISRFYPDKHNFPNLKHPPVLIDDFVGESINQEIGRFSETDVKSFKELINATQRYGGPNALPLKMKLTIALLMKKYKLTYKDLEELYTKYANNWGEDSIFEFVGFIKGKEVKRITMGRSVFKDAIVTADDYELFEDETYDATRVVIKYVDQYGNPLTYAFDPLLITIDGPLQVIGPSNITLTGGSGAFYVKTIGKEGEAIINIGNDRFVKEIKIKVNLKKEEVKIETKKNTNRFTTFFKNKDLDIK
jgi:beta-galactosidase